MSKFPIVDYDDRYFSDCEHSREELLDMQQKIMSLASSGSQDIAKDMRKVTDVNDKEIEICLRYAYSKGFVDKERINRLVYRYFAVSK